MEDYKRKLADVARLQPLAEALFVALVSRTVVPAAAAEQEARHAWYLAEAFDRVRQSRMCRERP